MTLELLRAFPDSRLTTSFYRPSSTFPEFADIDVETSTWNHIPFLASDPRRALPLLSGVFRRKQLLDADVVVCSSAGFAHEVQSTAPKVVYCHNPPRWLHQPEDYAMGLSSSGQFALRRMRSHLERRDRDGALTAAGYIANSKNVAARIRAVYGRDATVINPPRGISPDGPIEAVPGLEPGFLLTIGRPRGYKQADIIAMAVAGMPEQRLVMVGGQVATKMPPNVRRLSGVSDAQLRWLYRESAAVLACSREDFGLTPVEAFGFGTPVGATREGGYLETCVAGLTGQWLDASSLDALRGSITRLVTSEWDRAAIVAHGERWAPETFHASVRAYVRGVV